MLRIYNWAMTIIKKQKTHPNENHIYSSIIFSLTNCFHKIYRDLFSHPFSKISIAVALSLKSLVTNLLVLAYFFLNCIWVSKKFFKFSFATNNFRKTQPEWARFSNTKPWSRSADILFTPELNLYCVNFEWLSCNFAHV